ncbi:MAG: phosphoribosyl-AMP cyclohydrolase, partial [Kiritimatiellia bacterium]
MSHELEEGLTLNLDFTKISKVAANIKEEKDQVIPVAVQNADTKEVILLAYTNRQAMELTFSTRTLTLWSTSRNVLWEKGKTSGESFEVLEARVNCEQNSLVYFVRPRRSAICHTKNNAGTPRNCYYRAIDMADGHSLT